MILHKTLFSSAIMSSIWSIINFYQLNSVTCAQYLKDPAIFKSVKAEGLSVEWVTGQDICPDELYQNSVSAE